MTTTPEEFAEAIEMAASEYAGDEELRHVAMDDIKGKLLRELGYGKSVDIFNSTEKWYA